MRANYKDLAAFKIVKLLEGKVEFSSMSEKQKLKEQISKILKDCLQSHDEDRKAYIKKLEIEANKFSTIKNLLR